MDFAQITIEYVPNALCVESKSLKFYLASFRNQRAFNEAVTNRILDDFVKACAPREAVVTAEFSPRGGIGFTVRAEYPAREARQPITCSKRSMTPAVVLLSGGLDSAVTLAIAKRDGFEPHALSFDYGQRHRIEMEAARRVGEALGVRDHRFAQIDLRVFGGSALTDDIAGPAR